MCFVVFKAIWCAYLVILFVEQNSILVHAKAGTMGAVLTPWVRETGRGYIYPAFADASSSSSSSSSSGVFPNLHDEAIKHAQASKQALLKLFTLYMFRAKWVSDASRFDFSGEYLRRVVIDRGDVKRQEEEETMVRSWDRHRHHQHHQNNSTH